MFATATFPVPHDDALGIPHPNVVDRVQPPAETAELSWRIETLTAALENGMRPLGKAEIKAPAIG